MIRYQNTVSMAVKSKEKVKNNKTSAAGPATSNEEREFVRKRNRINQL